MTGLSVLLESFSDADGDGSGGHPNGVLAQQKRAIAYSEGYAAGEAAALANQAERNELLKIYSSALKEEIGALPERFNAELCGALIAIVQKVLPPICTKRVRKRSRKPN